MSVRVSADMRCVLQVQRCRGSVGSDCLQLAAALFAAQRYGNLVQLCLMHLLVYCTSVMAWMQVAVFKCPARRGVVAQAATAEVPPNMTMSSGGAGKRVMIVGMQSDILSHFRCHMHVQSNLF